jgi:hypothetical protein
MKIFERFNNYQVLMFQRLFSERRGWGFSAIFPTHGCLNRDNGTNNRNYDGSPPQGPSRGTAGQFGVFLEISVVDPPLGRPVGGGGNSHNFGYGGR